MHDPEAFISKGFKSTAAMAIKVKLKTNPNHFELLRKNLRIIIKNILKKSNSFWLKFKSELRIKANPLKIEFNFKGPLKTTEEFSGFSKGQKLIKYFAEF